MMRLRDIESSLPPGFRFHPSDEELVCYYLRPKVAATSSSSLDQLIAVSISPATSMLLVEVDLHVCEPWDLPEAAKLGDRQEWYFFSRRDQKYATGPRTNRATPHGYWKVTGKDKVVHDRDEHGNGTMMVVGTRKTLVFYLGRAPNGRKSDWVMHEFRLGAASCSSTSAASAMTPPQMEQDWVLCRVFHKGKGEADNGGSSNVDMIASSSTGSSRLPALCSPPQPAHNLDGGRLFPTSVGSYSSSPTIIIISSGQQLVMDSDDHGVVTGQYLDAPTPAPAMIQQHAAAGDAVVAGSSAQLMDMQGYGENVMREMETMMSLQPGANNYFP